MHRMPKTKYQALAPIVFGICVIDAILFLVSLIGS